MTVQNVPPPMFSKTGSSDFPDKLKVMVSGPPKSGKTTLLGTVPNILVLDTEPHANNLQSIAHLDIPFKAITSTDDLRQAQFVLSQDAFRQQAAQALGMPAIEAVAIDTLDTLQALMKKERMREQRATQFYRDDWGWLKEEMTSILESFLSLPMHVFFVVHTKTKDIGTEKNPKTIILPGLEGAISESIAGMVGYSLLSFRSEEIAPDGTKFTKYWLRAEGNDLYEFLGNRAGGRLPDVIEPDFKTLYGAAMAGRPQNQHQSVQVDFSGLQAQRPVPQGLIQTGGQIPAQPGPQQAQQPVIPAQQQPAQSLAEAQAQANAQNQPFDVRAAASPQAAAPQTQPVAQNPGQPEASGTPQNLPADSEPVNAAALGHVKKVYDALSLPFPEDKIKALNLGQARELVKFFRASQADHAEGRAPEGVTLHQEVTSYLSGLDLMPEAGAQQPEAKQVTPNLHGTIEEVKAYVGDDLGRANEAFEVERSGKNRTSLMSWLESKGASHGGAAVQTPVQTPEVPAEAPAQPTQAAPEAAAPVSPPAPAADAPSTEEEQKVALVQESLGGEVLSQEINPTALCEQCGNQIDDVDLAQIGKSRFGRVLCVSDYIAETKK